MINLLKAVDYRQANHDEIQNIRVILNKSKDNHELTTINIIVAVIYLVLIIVTSLSKNSDVYMYILFIAIIILSLTSLFYIITLYTKFSLLYMRKCLYNKRIYISNVKCLSIMTTNKGKGTLLYTFETGTLHNLKLDNPRHYGSDINVGDECYLVSFNNKYYSLIK